MRNVQEFKEFLTIDFMDEHNAYAHYPFQITFEDIEGNMTLGAMILGNVKSCYTMFYDAMKGGAKRCYMSLDFSAIEDMKYDFIAVFSYDYEDRNMNLVAIPYSTETGERFPEINYKDSEVLSKIFTEFCFAQLKEAGLV